MSASSTRSRLAVLIGLARHTPLLPGARKVMFVDIDDTMRQTYGYTKQGAGYGYTGVKGLNALIAAVSTPAAAPVLLRADSAYYQHAVVAAAGRAGAKFSITAGKDRAVTAAIAGIDAGAWVPIGYPQAVFDEQLQQWVSDAEVAETAFTAFTSRRRSEQVTGRLIGRRVRYANPDHVSVDAQGELFPAWRHHGVFTDSPLPLIDAEACHRRHAIIEQVIADLKNAPLAHLPCRRFTANSAWLVLATIAFNLTRAAGCLTSAFHAKATTATVRTQLIDVPARITRSARKSTLRLPQH